ncbi:hypothetical protein ACFVFH_27770 [Streptomyces sp. NPDC057697]|uniref:hypothetical protein n=1 Tax=Streptomyces sp. NPDC057697 TaxID=3346219 RepID=UPI0036B8FA4A
MQITESSEHALTEGRRRLGYVGDPAYDGGLLLKTWAPTLHASGDLRTGLHRALGIFAEAAGLDPERVRRWAQFHAVKGAFWGRRHGFRRARGGPRLELLTQLMDSMAESLSGRR